MGRAGNLAGYRVTPLPSLSLIMETGMHMVRNDYHRAAVCHIPWLAILALMLGGGEACAISIRHDQPVASYNTHAEAFGATGYLADDAGQFCTATLVTSGALLTAAHCVDDDFDGQLDLPATDIAFGLERNVPGYVPSCIPCGRLPAANPLSIWPCSRSLRQLRA